MRLFKRFSIIGVRSKTKSGRPPLPAVDQDRRTRGVIFLGKPLYSGSILQLPLPGPEPFTLDRQPPAELLDRPPGSSSHHLADLVTGEGD